jgi:hypothetical protein
VQVAVMDFGKRREAGIFLHSLCTLSFYTATISHLKGKSMKPIPIAFMTILLVTSHLAGAAFEKRAQSRSVSALISSEKPLSSGRITLDIAVEVKQDNMKIEKVSVKAFMPAMPGMPAMESKSDATLMKPGVYRVPLAISMSGTWQLHIYLLTESGKKLRIKSAINVN